MNAQNLKKTSETDWARVDALTDETIDTSDVPPLDDTFFANAKVRMPDGATRINKPPFANSFEYHSAMNLTIEYEQEDDGRWLAEVVELPGALAHGESRAEAVARVKALALRLLANRLEHGESTPELTSVSFLAA